MAERDPEAWTSDPAEARAPEQAAGDSASLRAELEAARNAAEQHRDEAEQYRGLAQRVQADFVNYKRRTEAESESRAEAVRAETIRAFLPIVDDLERALAHIPPRDADKGWVQGFRLIERNLAALFERLGVRRLGAEGEPFDPNVHEAVAYEEHPHQPEGHLAAVMRPGYQLGERVVRPAQVVVARPNAESRQDDEEWSHHRGRPGHGNGGGDRSDLHRPRHIERA